MAMGAMVVLVVSLSVGSRLSQLKMAKGHVRLALVYTSFLFFYKAWAAALNRLILLLLYLFQMTPVLGGSVDPVCIWFLFYLFTSLLAPARLP